LLQRRNSLTTTFQAMVDGLIVLLTVYFAFFNTQGFFSTIDAVFMITLLAIMGVSYDQMGIYRQFGGFIRSARKLFFAWSMSFAITLFIFIMAQFFEELSRPVLGAVFGISFAGQLANRWILMAFRMQTAHSNADRNNVLLIGGGPWLNTFTTTSTATPGFRKRR
jgi:putative colanic acid biosynthesis UDP-glucose lipid carrier transferase